MLMFTLQRSRLYNTLVFAVYVWLTGWRLASGSSISFHDRVSRFRELGLCAVPCAITRNL